MPLTEHWKAALADYVVRLLVRGVVAFGLLAATASNLKDLSEVESAILIGAVFGVHDVWSKFQK